MRLAVALILLAAAAACCPSPARFWEVVWWTEYVGGPEGVTCCTDMDEFSNRWMPRWSICPTRCRVYRGPAALLRYRLRDDCSLSPWTGRGEDPITESHARHCEEE